MSETTTTAAASERPNDPESMRYEKPPQYYYVWQKTQNIPVYDTFYLESLKDAELKPWDLFGGNGCFVNLTDSFLVGSFILEIPPGKSLNRMRHLFEGTVYVVEGRGETVIEQPGYPKLTVSWQKNSLFAPPLNTHYQHINRDKERPARLLVVNNAPLVMSLFHDERFLFNADFAFDRRFKGEADFFDRPAKYLGSRLSEVNYVRDVNKLDLYNWEMRGKGARTTFLSLSDNTLAAHISSFEVGTYKKAHRHGAGAHVVMLNGQGYSLLWRDGEPRQRVEWRAGTMFAPPEWWYHQHFNTGPEPARYLAVRNNNPTHPLRMGLPGFGSKNGQFGKAQIEFEDEDPVIYEDYARELERNGVPIRQEKPVYNK
ncbi:MAG: hypothetical protein ACM30I_12850 [Gemmatimonas sp.]